MDGPLRASCDTVSIKKQEVKHLTICVEYGRTVEPTFLYTGILLAHGTNRGVHFMVHVSQGKNRFLLHLRYIDHGAV